MIVAALLLALVAPPSIELYNKPGVVAVSMIAFEYPSYYCNNFYPYPGVTAQGVGIAPNSELTLLLDPKSPQRCFPVVFSLGPDDLWSDQCIYEVVGSSVKVEKRVPSDMICTVQHKGAWLLSASQNGPASP